MVMVVVMVVAEWGWSHFSKSTKWTRTLSKFAFSAFKEAKGRKIYPFLRKRGKTSSPGPIAQGLEHWSCKPGVASSNLAGACGS